MKKIVSWLSLLLLLVSTTSAEIKSIDMTIFGMD